MEIKQLGPGFAAEVRGVGIADVGQSRYPAARPALARRPAAAHGAHHDLGQRGRRPGADVAGVNRGLSLKTKHEREGRKGARREGQIKA